MDFKSGSVEKIIGVFGYSGYEIYLFLKYNGHLPERIHELFIGEHFLEEVYQYYVSIGWGQPFADLPENLKNFIKEKNLLTEIKKQFPAYKESDYVPLGGMKIIIKAVQEDMKLFQKQNPSIFSVVFYSSIQVVPTGKTTVTLYYVDKLTKQKLKVDYILDEQTRLATAIIQPRQSILPYAKDFPLNSQTIVRQDPNPEGPFKSLPYMIVGTSLSAFWIYEALRTSNPTTFYATKKRLSELKTNKRNVEILSSIQKDAKELSISEYHQFFKVSTLRNSDKPEHQELKKHLEDILGGYKLTSTAGVGDLGVLFEATSATSKELTVRLFRVVECIGFDRVTYTKDFGDGLYFNCAPSSKDVELDAKGKLFGENAIGSVVHTAKKFQLNYFKTIGSKYDTKNLYPDDEKDQELVQKGKVISYEDYQYREANLDTWADLENSNQLSDDIKAAYMYHYFKTHYPPITPLFIKQWRSSLLPIRSQRTITAQDIRETGVNTYGTWNPILPTGWNSTSATMIFKKVFGIIKHF